jgi:hypothetical protein
VGGPGDVCSDRLRWVDGGPHRASSAGMSTSFVALVDREGPDVPTIEPDGGN